MVQPWVSVVLHASHRFILTLQRIYEERAWRAGSNRRPDRANRGDPASRLGHASKAPNVVSKACEVTGNVRLLPAGARGRAYQPVRTAAPLPLLPSYHLFDFAKSHLHAPASLRRDGACEGWIEQPPASAIASRDFGLTSGNSGTPGCAREAPARGIACTAVPQGQRKVKNCLERCPAAR
jgi:hypothetical protein